MIHAAPDSGSDFGPDFKASPRERTNTHEATDAHLDNSQIKSYVERIVRLREERKALGDDIADILQESASRGYNKRLIKKAADIAGKSPEERQKMREEDDELSLYLSAAGLA